MADKEEMILIDVINPGINCVYRLDNDPKGQSLCKHNGNMEPVTAKDCRNCDEGMSRQEAINRMAKAMCHSPFESCEGCIVQKKKQACKQALEGMKELAETALNALLEDNNVH